MSEKRPLQEDKSQTIPESFNIPEIERIIKKFLEKDAESADEIVEIFGLLEKGCEVSIKSMDSKVQRSLRHLFRACSLEEVGKIEVQWKINELHQEFKLKAYIKALVKKYREVLNIPLVKKSKNELNQIKSQFKELNNIWGKSEREQKRIKQNDSDEEYRKPFDREEAMNYIKTSENKSTELLKHIGSVDDTFVNRGS